MCHGPSPQVVMVSPGGLQYTESFLITLPVMVCLSSLMTSSKSLEWGNWPTSTCSMMQTSTSSPCHPAPRKSCCIVRILKNADANLASVFEAFNGLGLDTYASEIISHLGSVSLADIGLLTATDVESLKLPPCPTTKLCQFVQQMLVKHPPCLKRAAAIDLLTNIGLGTWPMTFFYS